MLAVGGFFVGIFALAFAVDIHVGRNWVDYKDIFLPALVVLVSIGILGVLGFFLISEENPWGYSVLIAGWIVKAFLPIVAKLTLFAWLYHSLVIEGRPFWDQAIGSWPLYIGLGSLSVAALSALVFTVVKDRA